MFTGTIYTPGALRPSALLTHILDQPLLVASHSERSPALAVAHVLLTLPPTCSSRCPHCSLVFLAFINTAFRIHV